MDKNQLKEVISEQKQIFEKDRKIVLRQVSQKVISSQKITVITGIRRCGKSTLLRQISKQYENYGYINFEDERLIDFVPSDFNLLLESFLEINPDVDTFFFDEIQNVKAWEKFARRLFSEGYKLFITGSNANLLSSEIATSLTGRNVRVELYPFSFKEYLKYKDFDIKGVYSTKERANLSRELEGYLKYGGFPEIIKSESYEELSQLYQDILINDLLVRLKIRDSKDFRELALYLLSNISKRISYNNLKNLLGFSNTSKVKNYIESLNEAYLFYNVNKYDSSIKKQIRNEKKVYCIDQGLINSVAFKNSREEGRILENIVFIELKRRGLEVYYEGENKECDFLIKKGSKIVEAIQVTYSLADGKTKQREIKGLIDALEKYGLDEGTIITKNHEGEFEIEGRRIIVRPLRKFLLGIL